MRKLIPACIALLCLANFSAADEPVRDHDITIDDYVSVAMPIDCVMSPDGRYVAYTDLRWKDQSDRRDYDIWVAATDGSEVRRLTFDSASDGSPQWSPDSKWIYFTSARGDEDDPPRNGKTQVWRISLDGERVIPVTRLDKSLSGYELSEDGKTLYYKINRDQNDDEWKDLRDSTSDSIDFSHGERRVSEIWRLNLQNWRSEKVVDDERYISNFDVSPDEKFIAMHTAPDDELISNEGWSRVDVYDAESKMVVALPDKAYREEALSPYGWVEEIAWASDSEALAFTVGWDGYPNELYVAEKIDDQCEVRRLDRPTDGLTIGGHLHWRPNSREICFLGDFHARSHVYSIADVRDGKQGAMHQLTPGDFAVRSYSFSPTSREFAIIYNSPEHARELFMVEAPGEYRRLTDMNPQMRTWKMPQIKLVSWTGANGDTVEGVLELPYGYDSEKDGPLPMIVELHGGPTAATYYAFRFWCYGRTIMAANGYALLSPNYHGSTGYGDKFMTDLIGQENDIEIRDIMSGVDAMIERGIADGDRLGVMGWSNGGFLTNAIITHTQRFKAASSGAGIADMLIQWSVEDTPGHVINYMRGLPWETPEAYRKASPIWNMGKVTTPTLVHCGSGDPRVPVAHSQAIYRALHKYTNVPSMLLQYPDQGHGLAKLSMRKAKMEWDLAWYKKYILGEEE